MFTRKKFITFLRHPSPSLFPPPPLSLSFSIISQFSMARSKKKTAVNRMDGLESLDPCVLRLSTHTAPIIILEGGKRNEKKKPAHDTHDTHDVFFSSAHRRLISLSLPTYLTLLPSSSCNSQSAGRGQDAGGQSRTCCLHYYFIMTIAR